MFLKGDVTMHVSRKHVWGFPADLNHVDHSALGCRRSKLPRKIDEASSF